MSRRAEPRRPVALSYRSLATLAVLALVLAPAQASWGQAPSDPILVQDEIDIAGRQTLTQGSGARAFGMGGAFLARADDATAASWNPAGLSYLRLSELSVVGNYNVFEASRRNDRDELRGGAPDFASFTWPVRIRAASGSVQVNYQRAVSFDGSRTIERENAPFDNSVFRGDGNGGFDVIALGTGFKLTRALRLGATLNRWFNGYTVTLDKLFPGFLRQRRILGQDFNLQGWSSNLGFIVSPVEQVNLAAVFKTSFTGKVNLAKTRKDFFVDPNTGEELGTTQNAAESDDVRVDFPWSLGFGVSCRPRNALTLSADYTKTNWSQARIHDYFTVKNTPLSTPDQPPAPVVYPSLLYPYVNLESQNDTEEIRAGVEYVFIRGRLRIPLRAGYFNDKQINTFSFEPPPRFNGLTVGTGIILGRVVFDVAYLYEWGEFFESSELDPTTEAAAPAAAEAVRNTVRNQRFFASLIYRFSGRP